MLLVIGMKYRLNLIGMLQLYHSMTLQKSVGDLQLLLHYYMMNSEVGLTHNGSSLFSFD